MAEESEARIYHQAVERPSGILRYHRDELMEIQEAYVRTQEEWWEQILTHLGPEVAEEFHELQAVPDTSQFRRRSKNSERRLRSKAKRDALHALSMNALESDRDGHEEYDDGDSSDTTWRRVNENTGRRSLVRKGSWEKGAFYVEDTPEAESFQPPAFAVAGEPDFESGSPQDGWEYLRRVKYEAARCPKVVVADIDPIKLLSEQTPYMPDMPAIPVCPPDLLPSKEWEKQFLGDFSLLRMALSSIQVLRKSASEKIPALRNKAAWEVCCFGSITSAQHEEYKEPDVVTIEGLAAESGAEESTTESIKPSLPLRDSGKNASDFVPVQTRLEHVDNEKDPSVDFLALLDTQLDQLLNTVTAETNYVIDLGLLKSQVFICAKQEEFFDESEYLISGEPVEAHHVKKAEYSCAGVVEFEDDLVSSAQLQDFLPLNVKELGHVEDSSSGIKAGFGHLSVREPEEQHLDTEVMKSSSSSLNPLYAGGDQLTTADFMRSGCASAKTLIQIEVESSTGTEAQAEHLATRELESTENGIKDLELSSLYFDVLEHDSEKLKPADFMDSVDGYAQALNQVDFGESCNGLDTQFEYLTIGEPEGTASEIMLPSYSYPESSEYEDLQLPSTNFIDAFAGLEIFRSGDILLDELDESLDVDSNEFKVDESLEELFTKVFQLTGIPRLPFIHLLLRLDEVSRAALFRYHVSWLEHVDGLPLDRALWLLALSAVVDIPLDAQTSATFRALLRHCSGVRASKETRDDEDLYMLNVLIAVSGLYFGQAEANLS